MVYQPTGKPRGFATMTPERKREIASKGGKAAWVNGTANKWTSETAREAGRKGGSVSRRTKKTEPTPVEQALTQIDQAFGLVDVIEAAYRKHFG